MRQIRLAGWRPGSMRRTRTPLRFLTLWLASLDGNTARPPGAGSSIGAAQAAQVEQWFARYQLPLLDYLYGMTRDHEWAADLAQETFLRACTVTDLTAIEHPQAWLYRIATNVAISALRRRKRFGWLPLSAIEPEAGDADTSRQTRLEMPAMPPRDIEATAAERDAVWAVLAELPPRWRAVLLLQTAAGFEVREIAMQLRLSEANVRKLLFRAKERFRTIYAHYDAMSANGGAR